MALLSTRRFGTAALVAAAFFSLFAFGGCDSQRNAIANKPALKINKREVTAKEFADRLALRLKDFDALYAKDEANLKRAKEQTIQAFIMETVARDFARASQLTADAKELDAEAAKIRASYPDDLAFRRSLAQENLPYDKWRESLDLTILQRKIFAKIVEGLPEPTEAEHKEFYEANKSLWERPARIRLRQIVLSKEEDAKRILDQLQNGGDMARLAKEFSVAPEGVNGGDTGWLDKGTLEVFDQGFKMNIGARSKILKSPYGYHVYEVLKKESEGRLSFSEAKAKIRAQLMERREQNAFAAWLEQQVRKASVHRDDALIDAIKVTTRAN